MEDAKGPGPVRQVRSVVAREAGEARTLDDVAPVGIFRTDRAGGCIYVNDRWRELAGLSLADALGNGWVRALHPEDRETIWAAWTATVREGRPFRFEYRFVRPDGQSSWVIGEAYAEHDGSGETTGFVGTVTDISALKDAEIALRREKELTENVIDSSVDGILAFDRECRFTVWNPAMELLSGVPASETLGRPAFDVFPFLKEIGEDQYMYEALAGRNPVARDRRYAVPSTGRSGFFEARYTPIRNAEREVIGGLAIVRDVTELKNAQAKLVQAGKLAAMGQLGAGIAHELNQPLAGIQLLLSSIRRQPDRPIERVTEELDMIAEQITRMGRIVDNVRAFARKSNFQPGPTSPLQPLDRAQMLMAEQLRLSGIELATEIENDLPLIHGDAVQLQQVFLNLLSNALHALEVHEGVKRVDIGARSRGEAVEFWVQDSGPGISVEVRDNIFEPFFTTKEPGRGTGLGLSLCYGIVQGHSGEIHVEQPEVGGTRVVFRIPVARDARLASADETTVEQNKPDARILVVDDEAMLRKVIGSCLVQLGYSFEVAADARSALCLAAKGSFDLALIDLKMPTVDGRALCAKLRGQHPELTLVVMSGFVTEEDHAELDELGVAAVLSKPFTATELGKTLALALGAREAD